MKHAQKYLEQSKGLDRREAQVKERLNRSTRPISNYFKLVFLGLTILFFWRLFRKKRGNPKKQNTPRRKVRWWILEKLLEGVIYYLFTNQRK